MFIQHNNTISFDFASIKPDASIWSHLKDEKDISEQDFMDVMLAIYPSCCRAEITECVTHARDWNNFDTLFEEFAFHSRSVKKIKAEQVLFTALGECPF